jgi:uncharacterized membrane protein
VFLQFAVCATVFLDISIARQIIGFVYFTFVPGFIIVKLLRMNQLSKVEDILFSMGISVAFLMFMGVLVNQFGFQFGLQHPLSVIPLMVVFNTIILASAVCLYLRNGKVNFFDFGLEHQSFSRALLLIIIPTMGVLGVMLLNVYQNNSVLLVLMLAIPLVFVLALVSKRYFPPRLYPLVVLAVAVSILLSSSLISKYVVPFGSDINLEAYVFKTTQSSAHWDPSSFFLGDERFQRLNAMLSITVLPTVYSSLLNIDSTSVFKILVPLIFSLVPLGLYQLWQNQVGKRYAFMAILLFMAESTFYTELLGLVRQIIAELFFILILLVIFNEKIKSHNKVICFTIFSIALVTSHYAIAEIFLFFISLTFIMMLVTKKPRKNITVGMVLSFLVIMFSWYIYTSNASTYNAFASYTDFVYKQQIDFLNPGSRGQTVLLGLGLQTAPSVWNIVSRVFAYLTEGLIVIGFLGLITKRTRIKVEREYIILSFVAVVLLAAVVLLPGLANTFNMTRFYHVLLFLLSPLCVLGGEVVLSFFSKRSNELRVCFLLLTVLVPYFLFQTGFVYEVAKVDSYSLTLSMYRMDPYRLHSHSGYIFAEDVFSASWASENINFQNDSQVYADASSQYNILLSHGMMLTGYVNILSNTTLIPPSGAVYLNWLNVAKGTVAGAGGQLWNTSDFSPMLANINKIYSNGASEIYENTSPQTIGT